MLSYCIMLGAKQGGSGAQSAGSDSEDADSAGAEDDSMGGVTASHGKVGRSAPSRLQQTLAAKSQGRKDSSGNNAARSKQGAGGGKKRKANSGTEGVPTSARTNKGAKPRPAGLQRPRNA